MSLFKKDTETDKTVKYTDMDDETLDAHKRIQSYIIAGENTFETTFLTYCNYLTSLKEKDISRTEIPKEDAPYIREYLDWNRLKIDRNNFNFVIDFATAYEYINEIFPMHGKPKIIVKENQDTKSTSVEMTIKKINPDTGSNIHDDSVTFDFYTIPNRINSALEAMDSETSSMLEQYINEGVIDKDARYVQITRNTVTANDVMEKHLTLQKYSMDKIEDTYDRIWLQSIYNMAYHICKIEYQATLFSIEANILYPLYTD